MCYTSKYIDALSPIPHSAKEKAEKTFAFMYMNIMKDDGIIIRDGLHEFYVY